MIFYQEEISGSQEIEEVEVSGLVNGIASILLTIGVVAILAVILIMGIKYMMATPDEAAELKKKLIGLVTGGVLIIGSYGIWQLSYQFIGKAQDNRVQEASQNLPNLLRPGQTASSSGSSSGNSTTAVSSIEIKSPQSGTYRAGTELTIRVNFNTKIEGTAPELKLKVGSQTGTGTMSQGKVYSKYIEYTYITADQPGLVEIESYSGGSIKDAEGNLLSVGAVENSGNTVYIETGVELRGILITESVHAADWRSRGLLVTGFHLISRGDDYDHDGIDIDGVPTSPIKALKKGEVIDVINVQVKKGSRYVHVIDMKVRNEDGTIQNYLHLKDQRFKKGDIIEEGEEISSSGYIPESVTACAAGKVKSISEGHGRVDVDSGNGVVIRYLHMSSISVAVGDEIYQGQEVGKMGDRMSASDPPTSHVHLHISFVIDGKFENPRRWIYN